MSVIIQTNVMIKERVAGMVESVRHGEKGDV